MQVTLGQFASGFAPTLAVAVVSEPAQAHIGPLIDVGGIQFPVITGLLGLLGIMAARFLAMPKERTLGTARFLVVSAILLVVVELWIIESRPGWLFAFVVAIGLGFSGYSLIELLGDELKGLVTSAFGAVRDRLSGIGGKKADGPDDDA